MMEYVGTNKFMCVNVSLPTCTSKYNKEQKLSLGIADIGKSKRSVTMHCP